MGDLISRQAAIEVIENELDKIDHVPQWVFDRLTNRLRELPSAERKKGRWITKSTNGEMFDVCSVCGYVEWDEPHNYCPNCGAEMRRGE